MLLNNFFFIDTLTLKEGAIEATIHINTEHEILKGHFPGQPVVPGVCMTEMLREVIEDGLKKNLRLESASMIKFLTMFAPPQFTKATYTISFKFWDEDKLDINANLQFEDQTFMKFRGVYKNVGKS